MNRWAHWLSLFSAVMHLTIGLPEELSLGPRYLPASWAVIYGVLPDWIDWIWPALFTTTGLIALLGARNTSMMRLGFTLSAGVFGIWGLVGLYSWSRGSGGNIPGASANLYIAGCAWVLARYIVMGERGDEIDAKVHEIKQILPPDGDDETGVAVDVYQ